MTSRTGPLANLDAEPGSSTRTASSARRRATNSLLWTVLESGGLSILSVIALVVFAWTLSPADLGIGGLALSVVQLMNLPVELLFHDALIQRRKVTQRHFNTAFTVSLALGVALSGCCWGASDWLAAKMGEPRVAPVLQWMSLSLPAMGMASALASWHQREFNFRLLTLRSLVGRVGAFVVAVGLALAGAGVWALVVFQVLAVALGAVVLWTRSGHRPRLGFGRTEFWQLGSFGLRVVGARSVEFASLPLFMLYVSIHFGSDAAGYFSLAQRAVETLRAVITDAFAKLSLPLFARLQDSARLLRRAFEAATQLLCALTFPLFAGLAAVAPSAITVVFGPKWQPAAPVMAGLCLLAILVQARLYTPHVLYAVARPHHVLAIRGAELLSLALMLALIPAALPLALAAWVGRTLLAMPLDAWLVRRAIAFRLLPQFRPLLLPALLSLLMAVAVLGVDRFLPEALPVPVRLASEVVCGAILYASGMVVAGHPLVRHARRVSRATVRRGGP